MTQGADEAFIRRQISTIEFGLEGLRAVPPGNVLHGEAQILIHRRERELAQWRAALNDLALGRHRHWPA